MSTDLHETIRAQYAGMAQRRSPDDLRVRRTRERIRAAVRDLTLSVPFDDLTIHAIAKHAGIQRNTFYDHYPTKQAVLDEMLSELIVELEALTEAHFAGLGAQNSQDVPPTFVRLFELFGREADFYRRLVGREGNSAFAARVVTALEQSGMRHARYWSNLLPGQAVPTELAFRFLAAAFVGVLAWWLENDHDYTAAQMGEFLWRMEVRQS